MHSPTPPAHVGRPPARSRRVFAGARIRALALPYSTVVVVERWEVRLARNQRRRDAVAVRGGRPLRGRRVTWPGGRRVGVLLLTAGSSVRRVQDESGAGRVGFVRAERREAASERAER